MSPAVASPVDGRRITPQEYLASEKANDTLNEYVDGGVIPMECASDAHARIGGQVLVGLGSRLRGSGCSVRMTGRVRVSPTRYLVPDVMVVCGKSEYADDGRDTITNPRVVVEVLSPSTRDRDLGSKLRMYGSLPSFGELLAVYQDQPRVEIMRKHDDKHWTIDITSDLDELVSIATLGIQIPMSEFYEGVEFLQD